MGLRVILLSLTLIGIFGNSRADTDHIFRIAPLIHEKSGDRSAVGYEENYNENMVPILSRDLTLLQQAVDTIDNGACREQCQLMLNGLRNLTTWAVKFYDASGKFPDGVLGGSVFQLGNFDECLDIGVDDGAPQGIRGQYCLGEVGIQVPDSYLQKTGTIWDAFREPKERYEESVSKLHWGICVPAACGPQEVEEVIHRILPVAFSGSRLQLTPRVPEKSCIKDEEPTTNLLDIIYLSAISTVTSIVVCGTVFHVLCMRNKDEVPKGNLPQVLLAFSVISNLKKLFGPAHADDLYIDCISGIKFVSMVLIVIGHSLIFVISGPVLNNKFWREAVTKVENSIFLNNPLLVDTFLLLSAFLFCRILLRELDKRKSVNFFLLFIYRYIRITPAYLVIVGLYVTWLPRLDTGPFWSRMEIEKERCLSSWWANILYINNYVNTNNMCMFQSWYLSVDTQLFILAPAVIYPLWKSPRLGKCILAGVTIVSMVIPFVVTLVNHSDPTLMIYTAEMKDISTNDYFKTTYIKTHMRAEAYCFGLITGYIVYRLQTSDIRLSKRTVKLGWIVGSPSLFISMYSISLFYGPRKNFTVIEAAIYSSLHRTLWSIGISWIIIACITDNSGPIRNILKWRPFVPLSRLTYSAYLVNGLVELHSASTIRTPEYLDNLNLLKVCLSHLMLTFGGAIILSTIFESPILGIERMFLRAEKLKANSIKEKPKEDTTGGEI